MRIKFIFILLLLAGCASDKERCAELGAPQGSPQYFNCLSYLGRQRADNLDATANAIAANNQAQAMRQQNLQIFLNDRVR